MSKTLEKETKADAAPEKDKQLVKLTMEQKDTVKKIQQTENLYKIVGCNREATQNEIKLAGGKRLAILGQKNTKDPDIEEAAKKVQYAMEYLLDASKRKNYDNLALAKKQPFEKRKIAEKHWYDRFESKLGFLIAGFVLVLLLFVALDTDPHYSLMQTDKYTIERRTNEMKVPFYVRKDFCSQYYSAVCELEKKVEKDYMQHLKELCTNERKNRDTIAAKAQKQGDKELQKLAADLPLPSCETLKEYIPNYDF